MVSIKITVYSILDGNSSGYITFEVPSDYKIKDLLKLYCSEKGIQLFDDYMLISKENIVLNPQKTLKQEGINNGDFVKLSQFDKSEQLFAFGSWWIIIGLAFMIGCVGLVYSFYLYFPLIVPQKYGLVIDAGSTHSQLFVFKLSKINTKEIANIVLIHDCMMPGGVAEYRSHTQDLHKYFIPCLSEAEDIIPDSSKPSTPLILAATAGMRILRAYDPDGAALVLSAIREVFWAKTRFATKEEDVFVASGEEEGISGWTAVNYLMENFEEPEENSQEASALDLGGASVQVTTEVWNETNQWPTLNITIFRNTYNIFSKSFLCYGISEAKHRYQYLLVSSPVNQSYTNIENPCLPVGFYTSFTSEDFFNPCIFSNETEALLGKARFSNKNNKRFLSKYISKDFIDTENESEVDFKQANNEVYILNGTGDVDQCREEVEKLFNYEICKQSFTLGDCLNKKLIPPYQGELVGFSSIFLKLFPLLNVSLDGTLQEFQDAILSKCSMTGEELYELHSNVSNEMLQDLCFDGMYVYTLLTEGLGITSQKWKDILFTNKVNKQNVVWATGLMLNRTAKMNTGSDYLGIDFASFSLLSLLFIGFLFTSFLLIWYTIKSKKRGNVYQRVHTTVVLP